MKLKTKLKIIKGRPDLTPMINVIFLLLIFFMLYSSFVQVSGIKVDLPETETVSEHNAQKLVITVDKKNQFYFNDQPMEWEKLKERLGQFTSRWKADAVIIRADKNTAYGVVVRLMTLARSLNLNVYVATVFSGKGREPEFEDVTSE